MFGNDIERTMREDLSATPIGRTRMDLLWLNPQLYTGYKPYLRSGGSVTISDFSGDPNLSLVFQRLNDALNRGALTVEDIEWAERVDEIAVKGDQLSQQERFSDAIKVYRRALQQAPGCDIYLMNIGNAYGMLGMFDIGYKYLKRAAEINPTSPRIGRNLHAIQAEMRR